MESAVWRLIKDITGALIGNIKKAQFYNTAKFSLNQSNSVWSWTINPIYLHYSMFYLITAHYTTGFEHKLSDNNYRHINAQIKQNWTSLTKKRGSLSFLPN